MKHRPLVHLLFCICLFICSSCKERDALVHRGLSPSELEKIQAYANTELDKAPGQLTMPELPENYLTLAAQNSPSADPLPVAASKPVTRSKSVKAACSEMKACTPAQRAVIHQIDENIHKSLIFYRQAEDSLSRKNFRKDLEKQRRDRETKIQQYFGSCYDCK